MLRNVRLLYVHNFLSDCRFQEAFLVIRFAQIAGSYTAAMAVLSVVTITSALMDVPTGIFSDRVGRRYTFMAASVCATLMIICYALADHLALLYVGSVFSGISQALFSGNNNALLYESLKAEKLEKEYGHYRGRTGSMYQLALSLSAFAASLLAKDSLRLVFLLGIVPQALSVIVSAFFKEPRVHIKTEKHSFGHLVTACREIWRNPRLRLLMLASAISYGAGESSFSFKAAYIGTLWPTWAVGIFRGINHLGGFFGYWFTSKILRYIKPPHFLVFREAYWFVTQNIAVLMSNIYTPVVMLTGALVWGPGEVAREQLMQQEFTDHQRATMASVGSFFASLFYAVIAILIGVIADRFSLAAGLGFAFCVAGLSLPIYVYVFRRHF